ncbi:hypothetical protein LTR24_003777 [Lithohypha guttulata]|uniref:Methylated-DNA--protein-cysteine methyltransferase n=1 Tax=Lithohypha guttulata TaxID=1690604 RepID=A0ABR0KE03_9EURO|nr:hypothetical protein LTR24_003777 [Lithohypha guttulata]
MASRYANTKSQHFTRATRQVSTKQLNDIISTPDSSPNDTIPHALMILNNHNEDAKVDTAIAIDDLRQTWKTLYTTTLPSLARTKDPVQPHWPVTLDHCFARIILDNTVGKGEQQWDSVIGRPAVKNMSEAQLRDAVELGGRIAGGDVDLVELDRRSLGVRGKEGKYGGGGVEGGKLKGVKRKRAVGDGVGREGMKKSMRDSKGTGKEQSTLAFSSSDAKDEGRKQLPPPATSSAEQERKDNNENANRSQLEKKLDVTSDLSRSQIVETLRKIHNHATLTPFRRRLYTSLLSVPKGRYTTYAALAEHLGSAARAVGNGMRNNPFAPPVPCHRVLASDGTLGGYGGDWGREGKYTPKQEAKVKLLGEEGVKFDSTGKVKGPVWKGFWDLHDFEREHGEIA